MFYSFFLFRILFLFFIAGIIHYRKYINPTLIARFNAEIDKLDKIDRDIISSYSELIEREFIDDYVRYFTEKSALVYYLYFRFHQEEDIQCYV